MSAALLTAWRNIWAALERERVPGPSPYWQAEAERLYTHATARTQVEMVGRAGDKTRESVVFGITETVADDFAIPVGERHYYTHVSENRDEAGKTLGMYEAYLRILGVRFVRSGDTIELAEMPRGIRVLACRVGAVSGWRCIGWTADECAKWNNEGADPSSEVVASIRAMTATHANARGRIISSPLATQGFFYETWQRGNTDEQIVGHAPTWVANISISEEQTRKLESDPRVHAREYAAMPQAAALAAFDPDAVERAFRPRPGVYQDPPLAIDPVGGFRILPNRPSQVTYRRAEAVIVIDPSSGAADTWTWGVARYLSDEGDRWLRNGDGEIRQWNDGSRRENPDWKSAGPPILKFDLIDGVEGKFWDQISSDDIVSKLVAIAKREGIREVHSDQREAFALRSAFERHGLRFFKHDWTGTNKPVAVEMVRRWLREGTLWLPKHDRMKRELLAFEERLTSSGQFTFRGRGSAHDDFVALLLTTALADVDPGLPMSPHKKEPPRGMGQSPIMPF